MTYGNYRRMMWKYYYAARGFIMTYGSYRQMVWKYYHAARGFKVMSWIPTRDLRSMIDRAYNDIH